MSRIRQCGEQSTSRGLRREAQRQEGVLFRLQVQGNHDVLDKAESSART